ncbi:hypothetical protein GO986_09615 [Deinococcus sp. HMF7620]|uniref:Uncharacterized protein n=1 Tax=Deinococcus arboris TaxID=2682977 RepID=A0A7C9M8K9_9DEIO|nr:hypothetical protein [Deinococcus arboris]MVN87023.1 hypothetical protein [Deinococcus arboris]
MTDPTPETPVSDTDTPSTEPTETPAQADQPLQQPKPAEAEDGTHGRPSDDSDPGHS